MLVANKGICVKFGTQNIGHTRVTVSQYLTFGTFQDGGDHHIFGHSWFAVEDIRVKFDAQRYWLYETDCNAKITFW